MRNLLWVLSIGVAACSASSTSSTFGGRLSITSPKNNATITAPADGKIPVSIDTNYILKPFGACNGQSGCGSVFLQVDQQSCWATGAQYNALATSSPTDVDLTLCPMVVGTHQITAELRQDDANHDFVEDSITKSPVTDSITIVVTQ